MNPPYYCPYCGSENLFPHEDAAKDLPRRTAHTADPPRGSSKAAHVEWECRSCRRVFAVKYIGLLRGNDNDRGE